MNNDKMFELLEKMYSQMINGFDNLKGEISEVKQQLNSLENRFSKMEIKTENEVYPKINTLFEGYVHTAEKIIDIDNKLDTLIQRVDNQEIQLRVIKTRRKAK